MDTGPDDGGRLYPAILCFLESAERGILLDQESFLATYPEVALQLKDFLNTYTRVERMTAPVRDLVRHAVLRAAAPPVEAGRPRGKGSRQPARGA